MITCFAVALFMFSAFADNSGIALKDVPPQKVMAMNVHTSEANQVADSKKAIDQVAEYLRSKKVAMGLPFLRIKAQGKNKEFDFEVGWFVNTQVEGSGPIFFDTIPGGKVALKQHFGSYMTLNQDYGVVLQWMTKNKKAPGNSPWQVYISDPAKTPPDRVETDIYFPILP